MRLCCVLLFCCAVACGGVDGTGQVRVRFFDESCTLSDEKNSALQDFQYDANYLATDRFFDVLLIVLQAEQAVREETDGLILRVPMDTWLRDGRLFVDLNQDSIVLPVGASPLAAKTSTATNDVNVSLALFHTCPKLPQFYAGAGQFTLSGLTLRIDPDDTGDREHLRGRVQADLFRPGQTEVVAELEAMFDFAPPVRPLVDFQ